MWNMLWPILLVVAANCAYNICAKATPGGVNAFASLSVTYFAAGLVSVALFFLTTRQRNFLVELTKTNWTAWAFGLIIVALEFGYIFLYRAGWKVSMGSLVANISLACILLVVGVLLYHETITLRQLAGFVLCAAGLFLITK